MSLLLIPAGTGPSTDPVLTPEYISICAVDSGSGGNLLLNMQGVNNPTVAGAADLSTFFGKNINELPISRAFRPIYTPNPWGGGANREALSAVQIRGNLAVTIYPVGAAGVLLGVTYDGETVAGVQVPFLELVGSGVAQSWRIDLQLRHSITC
jgi:hypothetical protein